MSSFRCRGRWVTLLPHPVSDLLPRGTPSRWSPRTPSGTGIPSNIWVGVGKMGKKDVVFPARSGPCQEGHPVRPGQGHGDLGGGDADDARPGVDVEHTGPGARPDRTDPLATTTSSATGPQLKFQMTASARTAGTVSVCTADHVVEAAAKLAETIGTLRGPSADARRRHGHGTCTCEGAAFEYVFNVDHGICARRAYATGRAWSISPTSENSATGVGRMTFADMGFETSSELWTGSLFRERRVEATRRARHQGSSRDRPLRDARRHGCTRSTSTSPCSCRPSAGCRSRHTPETAAASPGTLFAPAVQEGRRRLHREAV